MSVKLLFSEEEKKVQLALLLPKLHAESNIWIKGDQAKKVTGNCVIKRFIVYIYIYIFTYLHICSMHSMVIILDWMKINVRSKESTESILRCVLLCPFLLKHPTLWTKTVPTLGTKQRRVFSVAERRQITTTWRSIITVQLIRILWHLCRNDDFYRKATCSGSIISFTFMKVADSFIVPVLSAIFYVKYKNKLCLWGFGLVCSIMNLQNARTRDVFVIGGDVPATQPPTPSNRHIHTPYNVHPLCLCIISDDNYKKYLNPSHY